MSRQSSPSASDSERSSTDCRLARNRKTARLRRQKKKAEAEKLTIAINEALARNTKLLKLLKNSSKNDQEEFKERSKSLIVSGCLFCDKIFMLPRESSRTREISDHYLNEHPHLVRNNKEYLGEGFLQLVEVPEQLLDLIRKLSQENNLSISKHDSYKMNSTLSMEEKRKIRLQRNAQSARFCRQRKKLYMQKLRLELPKLMRENDILEDVFRRNDYSHKILENSYEVDGLSYSRMNGWDTGGHTKKKARLDNRLPGRTGVFPRKAVQKMFNPGIDIYEAAFALSALRQE